MTADDIANQYDLRLIQLLGENYRVHPDFAVIVDEVARGRDPRMVLIDREERYYVRSGESTRLGW